MKIDLRSPPIHSHKFNNPETGDIVFGTVPPLKLGHNTTEESPIYLFWGVHRGPNKGGGVIHIWSEHQIDMQRLGLESIEDVPVFVKRIVRSGTSLHYEGGRMKGNYRTSAVRSSAGTAILEYMQHKEGALLKPYWRIITAYSKPKRIGQAVGRIK